MAEYIKREAVLKRITTHLKRITPIEENRDMFYHDSGVNGAITGALLEVKKVPAADVVEVVRCRDCKFHRVMSNKKSDISWHSCKLWYADIDEDDFCSYAERKG